MYEVRPEDCIHRVDSDTSLARAISKAEAIATTNKRRYVVVKVETVHVAEPGVVEVLPPAPVVTDLQRGCYFCGTFHPVRVLDNGLCPSCQDAEDVQSLMDRDRE